MMKIEVDILIEIDDLQVGSSSMMLLRRDQNDE
jgi:hypothetical protein